MKFCTHCGAELFDESIICVKCGRLVENPPLPQSKPPRIPRANGEPSILLIVSNFVHSLGIALSFFCFFSFSFTLAFVFSCVALAFGIISFVMTLLEKHKFERLFTSISRLTIAILSFVFILLILIAFNLLR